MRSIIVFLGVIISGAFIWLGYAVLYALISDNSLADCLGSDTVINLFLATGWILPLKAGYDLYRHLYRHEIRQKRGISGAIRRIKSNIFGYEKNYFHSGLRKRAHLK